MSGAGETGRERTRRFAAEQAQQAKRELERHIREVIADPDDADELLRGVRALVAWEREVRDVAVPTITDTELLASWARWFARHAADARADAASAAQDARTAEDDTIPAVRRTLRVAAARRAAEAFDVDASGLQAGTFDGVLDVLVRTAYVWGCEMATASLRLHEAERYEQAAIELGEAARSSRRPWTERHAGTVRSAEALRDQLRRRAAGSEDEQLDEDDR